MDVLSQQAVAIAVSQSIDEEIARLLRRPIHHQASINQNDTSGMPLRASRSHPHLHSASRGCRVRALAPMAATVLRETRIVRLDQANLGQEQDARIEVVQTEPGGEGAALLAPGLLEQSILNFICRRRPVCSAVVQAEMRGDCRQATAAGPTHCRGIGMNVAAAAIFPDARVGRERELCRLETERFQQKE